MNKFRKKTTATLLIALFMISAMTLIVPAMAKKKEGTRIQDGVLTYSAGHYLEGEPLVLGYDPYGYNYQGHMFNGYYCNAYLGRSGSALPPYDGDAEAYLAEYPDAANHWTWPYRDVKLMMKWNDAWLSNMDRNSDDLLDRHYGFDSYIGSGAWLTNHQSGTYTENGEEYHWTYFVKIVAAPSDAYVDGGFWYTTDNVEIGEVIWGAFAIIQQVENDPGQGLYGLQYLSPASAGFGYYQP
ncbi:MAG: hypothetical protein NWE89_16205 [Candidatus Bathyarchaeota archaeon]|nr:hypothetical protein [Candidatus Bathyarchaeota archaeon]